MLADALPTSLLTAVDLHRPYLDELEIAAVARPGVSAEAVKAAYDSPTYQDFMKERGFGLRWMGPDEATAQVASDDASLGAVMKEAGLAK